MTCESWPIVWPCDPPGGYNDEQYAAAVQGAQQLLWSKTGRRLGVCDVTEEYSITASGVCGMPYLGDDLVWRNRGAGAACCQISLMSQPVQVVDEVRVDGQVIDPSGYRLIGSRLQRLGACWPADDGCGAPRVQVRYRWGVPVSGAMWGLVAPAMGEVAAEFLAAICGGTCKLPSRAVSITRQGVTIELGGAPDSPGLLGLPLADMLIGATNPTGRQARSRVYSPDMARGNRVQSSVLPSGENIGGVSTVVLPDAYRGDSYGFTITFPDAVWLSGGVGTIQADVKTDPAGDVVASFDLTIAGAVLYLQIPFVDLAAGLYVTDVQVGDTTWMRKTKLIVREEVSDG